MPTNTDLKKVLGDKYGLWMEIRDQEFLAAFVFGKKALDAILESGVSGKIKSDLEGAKVYAEGRGVRIPVPDQSSLKDISSLIDIKLAF